MKIVTVTGYKGGVSKSTTAVHIATYFSDKGKTILIDGDPNRTAIAWSQRGKLPFVVADERQAMKLISGNDFVVIDTPARPNSNDLEELAKGCELLVLPTIPDVVSLEPMLQTANDLPTANYRALITVVPPSPSREGKTMQEDLTANKIPVFKTMIRRSAGFSKAALEGVPIRDLKEGRSRLAWSDYAALGKEIMEILNNG
jgi:chromosome partitioning protein